jgi:hypothetical protein
MAWCADCEKHIVQHGWDDELTKKADFKFLCSRCWNDAKKVLYDGNVPPSFSL